MNSLLEKEGEAFSVHRLVQAVTRERLGEEACAVWAEIALRLVESAFLFDEDDESTWPSCARLLPHALTTIDYGEAWRVAAEETGRPLDHIGGYFQVSVQFSTAHTVHLAELCKRALAIAGVTYSTSPPTATACINNVLGLVLWNLQKFSDAHEVLERALAMDETTYGPSHPTVARDLNNLGLILRDLGEVAGARTTLEQALAIDEAAYGPNHPTVARDLENLGVVLQDLEEFEGAREVLERALAIDEATYGPKHPKIARDLNNLGLVLRDLREVADARTALERALVIHEAIYGLSHPNVAFCLCNLGLTLWDLVLQRDFIPTTEAARPVVFDARDKPHNCAVGDKTTLPRPTRDRIPVWATLPSTANTPAAPSNHSRFF